MECMVPTVGVYPIATANDKAQISAPLMSRFAVIDTSGLHSRRKESDLFEICSSESPETNEPESGRVCGGTDDGLDAVIEQFANTTGIRDLEQAAEHIAANALYQIEVNHVSSVTFDAEMVKKLFE